MQIWFFSAQSSKILDKIPDVFQLFFKRYADHAGERFVELLVLVRAGGDCLAPVRTKKADTALKLADDLAFHFVHGFNAPHFFS